MVGQSDPVVYLPWSLRGQNKGRFCEYGPRSRPLEDTVWTGQPLRWPRTHIHLCTYIDILHTDIRTYARCQGQSRVSSAAPAAQLVNTPFHSQKHFVWHEVTLLLSHWVKLISFPYQQWRKILHVKLILDTRSLTIIACWNDAKAWVRAKTISWNHGQLTGSSRDGHQLTKFPGPPSASETSARARQSRRPQLFRSLLSSSGFHDTMLVGFLSSLWSPLCEFLFLSSLTREEASSNWDLALRLFLEVLFPSERLSYITASPYCPTMAGKSNLNKSHLSSNH